MKHRVAGLAALAIAASLFAQTNSATLRGTVRDTTEATIPSARVSVSNIATGLVTRGVTNESGAFEFPFLPPGEYLLAVEREGFQTYRQPGLLLSAGDVRRQLVTLAVGAASESITVSSSSTAVQNETAMLSSSIAPQRIEALPLLGRNFNTLITIQPGVIADGPSFNVNGGPSGMGFNITLDGTDATAVSTQRTAAARNGFQQTNTTSLESMQEIRVYTNNYSADVGRSSSGAVNVVTKSGTNDLHFGLFEFFRNSALNANSTTANAAGLPRAPIRLNQFGANAGGRIVRDRTFFWLGWENSNQRRGRTSNYTVLSPAGRAAIRDGSVRSYVDTWIPLPNQQPLATNPNVANLIRNEIVRVRESIGTARFDHRFSEKNNFFFRLNILNADTAIPTLYWPNAEDQSNSRQKLYTLTDTHTFSPAVVNEFRLGANRFVTPQVGGGPIPSMTVTGGILSSSGTSEIFANTAYHATDTLFMQKGRHGIKVGFEYRSILAGRKSSGNANFVFNNLNDFFANSPAQLSITQRYGGSGGTGGSAGFFVQDDWRATSRLTLNLGLRYDYFFVPGERTGRAYNILSGIPPIANVRFNVAGEPVMARDWNNLGPRFGFAYSVGSKLAVRGGYGIFFAPQQASTGVTMSANASPPFVSEQNADTAFIQPAVSFTRAEAALRYPLTSYGSKFPQPGPTVIDPKYRESYSQQWNLTVERELTRETVLSAGYVASKNTKVQGSVLYNLLRPLFNNTREDPRFTNIRYIGPLTSANYHSLQLVLSRRLRHGLTLDANYVWSHSIDDFAAYFGLNSGSAPAQNQGNLRGERGESEFDRRHAAKASFLYKVPSWNAASASRLLTGGWQISGIFTATSGGPFSVLTGRSIGDGLNNQRANVAPGANLYSGMPRRLNELALNRASFTVPTERDPATGYVLGNLGKSALAGPPNVNWDLAVHRSFRVSEKGSLQFRVEMFNAFNQVNFADPVSNMNNPNFGRIINAGAGREIQAALKLAY